MAQLREPATRENPGTNWPEMSMKMNCLSFTLRLLLLLFGLGRHLLLQPPFKEATGAGVGAEDEEGFSGSMGSIVFAGVAAVQK